MDDSEVATTVHLDFASVRWNVTSPLVLNPDSVQGNTEHITSDKRNTDDIQGTVGQESGGNIIVQDSSRTPAADVAHEDDVSLIAMETEVPSP